MSLLELKNVFRSFGGLVAVNSVSFTVESGDVFGLIGPNGAGKTTVFNLITGNYTPDSGQILFEGADITGFAPYRIVHMGIARTFQAIRLFQGMTVLENVLAGYHCRMHAGLLSSMLRLPRQRHEEAEAVKRAMQELAFVGLDHLYDSLAKNISYGNQRLLEIARALASSPRFLILDEPAGGMNDHETKELTRLIEAVQNRGITVLLIEHDMSLVMRVCSKLVVLEYGMVIAQGPPAEVTNNPLVIEAYLGGVDD